MSQAITLARPYARALFLIAKESGQFPAFSEALGFSARAAAEPVVQALFGDPRVAAGTLQELLTHPAAPAAFGPFLATLAENGRLALLPEVSALFEQLRAESERVVKATITSATELSDAELQNNLGAALAQAGRPADALRHFEEALRLRPDFVRARENLERAKKSSGR